MNAQPERHWWGLEREVTVNAHRMLSQCPIEGLVEMRAHIAKSLAAREYWDMAIPHMLAYLGTLDRHIATRHGTARRAD